MFNSLMNRSTKRKVKKTSAGKNPNSPPSAGSFGSPENDAQDKYFGTHSSPPLSAKSPQVYHQVHQVQLQQRGWPQPMRVDSPRAGFDFSDESLSMSLPPAVLGAENIAIRRRGSESVLRAPALPRDRSMSGNAAVLGSMFHASSSLSTMTSSLSGVVDGEFDLSTEESTLGSRSFSSSRRSTTGPGDRRRAALVMSSEVAVYSEPMETSSQHSHQSRFDDDDEELPYATTPTRKRVPIPLKIAPGHSLNRRLTGMKSAGWSSPRTARSNSPDSYSTSSAISGATFAGAVANTFLLPGGDSRRSSQRAAVARHDSAVLSKNEVPILGSPYWRDKRISGGEIVQTPKSGRASPVPPVPPMPQEVGRRGSDPAVLGVHHQLSKSASSSSLRVEIIPDEQPELRRVPSLGHTSDEEAQYREVVAAERRQEMAERRMTAERAQRRISPISEGDSPSSSPGSSTGTSAGAFSRLVPSSSAGTEGTSFSLDPVKSRPTSENESPSRRETFGPISPSSTTSPEDVFGILSDYQFMAPSETRFSRDAPAPTDVAARASIQTPISSFGPGGAFNFGRGRPESNANGTKKAARAPVLLPIGEERTAPTQSRGLGLRRFSLSQGSSPIGARASQSVVLTSAFSSPMKASPSEARDPYSASPLSPGEESPAIMSPDLLDGKLMGMSASPAEVNVRAIFNRARSGSQPPKPLSVVTGGRNFHHLKLHAGPQTAGEQQVPTDQMFPETPDMFSPTFSLATGLSTGVSPQSGVSMDSLPSIVIGGPGRYSQAPSPLTRSTSAVASPVVSLGRMGKLMRTTSTWEGRAAGGLDAAMSTITAIPTLAPVMPVLPAATPKLTSREPSPAPSQLRIPHVTNAEPSRNPESLRVETDVTPAVNRPTSRRASLRVQTSLAPAPRPAPAPAPAPAQAPAPAVAPVPRPTLPVPTARPSSRSSYVSYASRYSQGSDAESPPDDLVPADAVEGARSRFSPDDAGSPEVPAVSHSRFSVDQSRFSIELDDASPRSRHSSQRAPSPTRPSSLSSIPSRRPVTPPRQRIRPPSDDLLFGDSAISSHSDSAPPAYHTIVSGHPQQISYAARSPPRIASPPRGPSTISPPLTVPTPRCQPSLTVTPSRATLSDESDYLSSPNPLSSVGRRPRPRPPLPIGPRRPSPALPETPITQTMRRRAGSLASDTFRQRNPSSSSTHSNGPSLPTRSGGAKGSGPSSPKFNVSPVRWRGHTLEMAKWTFNQQELQSIVAKSIKESAAPSALRLLSLAAVETEIPQEVQLLETQSADLKLRYKVAYRKRSALLSTLSAHAEGAHALETAALQRLVTDLSESSKALDRLTEDLHSVTDQLRQLHALSETHSFSALAMALRKLNSSFLKQVTANQELKEQVAGLRVERDDAWKAAQSLAEEIDGLNEAVAASDGDVEDVGYERDASSRPGRMSEVAASKTISERMNRVTLSRKSSLRASKASLARSRSLRSSVASSVYRASTISGAPSATKSTFSVIGAPPVPRMPRRNTLEVSTELSRRFSALSTRETPSYEAMAMAQAQTELYDILGISVHDLLPGSRPMSSMASSPDMGPFSDHSRDVSGGTISDRSRSISGDRRPFSTSAYPRHESLSVNVSPIFHLNVRPRQSQVPAF